MKSKNGLAVCGSRATEIVPVRTRIREHFNASGDSDDGFGRRIMARTMSQDSFIDNHASGTLRKNKRIGLRWKTQYVQERIAFEFGFHFESAPDTRFTWGVAISEQDEKSLTEAGWHIDRYASVCVFPGDIIEAKYMSVEYSDGSVRKGVGIVVRETSADFVPEGHVVFCIIAEFSDATCKWLPAVNPC